MTIPEKAVEFAVNIAKDKSHGYDQTNRWGPDYDCSSLVIQAYREAGVPLTCTYTGNMRSNMLDNGFVIPVNVDLATGAGLQPGDVLLNPASHTAMYIGNGKLVHASGNENGKATGGKTGDQTGKEISICNYFNFPWDYSLRYVRKEEPEPEPEPELGGDVYTVQQGDSLWNIAERFLGDPWRYPEIMQANGMSSDLIHPGQVLVIPGAKVEKPANTKMALVAEILPETMQLLNIMADGWHLSIGEVIDKLMEDAR